MMKQMAEKRKAILIGFFLLILLGSVHATATYSLGDSITCGSGGYDCITGTGNIQNTYQYWVDQGIGIGMSTTYPSNNVEIYNLEHLYTGGTGSTCYNISVSQFEAWVPDNVNIYIMCGINDIHEQGKTPSQVESYLMVIYSEAQTKHDNLYIMEETPTSRTSITECGYEHDVNDWINNYFGANDIPVVEDYNALSNGTYCGINGTDFVDGLHPTVIGSQIIGLLAAGAFHGNQTDYTSLQSAAQNSQTGINTLLQLKPAQSGFSIAGIGIPTPAFYIIAAIVVVVLITLLALSMSKRRHVGHRGHRH